VIIKHFSNMHKRYELISGVRRDIDGFGGFYGIRRISSGYRVKIRLSNLLKIQGFSAHSTNIRSISRRTV